MYSNPLFTFHCLFRYAVLLLLVVTIIKYLIGHLGKRPFTNADDKLGLFMMIGVHLQFLAGIILYVRLLLNQNLADFGAIMKNDEMRFRIVEHPFIMIIAVAIITIGRVRSKKASEDTKKFKRGWIFYLVGFVLIMMGIPWLMEIASNKLFCYF